MHGKTATKICIMPEKFVDRLWLNTILLSPQQHVAAEGPASAVSGQTASATAQHHALTA